MWVVWQCTVPRAEIMFVTIQSENIRPSNKETRLLLCFQTVRCLQLGYESLRLLIADQQEIFRPPACFELPPQSTKYVYTPQRSTRDAQAVLHSRSVGCITTHFNFPRKISCSAHKYERCPLAVRTFNTSEGGTYNSHFNFAQIISC
jgi:hypothetical protein